VSNDHVLQHSGSRWEPPITTDPVDHRTIPTHPLGSAPAPAGPDQERGRRRRRGPLLAVLAAVLTLGASTAGIAYVQAAREAGTNEPAIVADAPQDRGPGVGASEEGDGAGDGTRQGDHRHHDGDRDDDGPGARDDDSAADGTTGELPS
jgi:hypothetical protein